MSKIEIINNKKFKYISDNIILVLPQSKIDFRPLFCPVCKFAMSNYADFSSYDSLSCCDFCAKKWGERNRKKWLSGWRPSKDDIKNEISYRKKLKILFSFSE